MGERMNKIRIAEVLKDYAWMMNSIMLLEKDLKTPNTRVTAMGGIEASMPKPQGDPSDTIFQEVLRRDKKYRKIYEYRKDCSYVTSRMDRITNPRELEILNLFLDGKSNRQVARHMGFGNTHVGRLRDKIVEKLTDK